MLINPGSLAATGYGEFDPAVSNKSKNGRKKNRRIEIILLPDLSELPTLPEDMATQAGQPKAETPPKKK